MISDEEEEEKLGPRRLTPERSRRAQSKGEWPGARITGFRGRDWGLLEVVVRVGARVDVVGGGRREDDDEELDVMGLRNGERVD